MILPSLGWPEELVCMATQDIRVVRILSVISRDVSDKGTVLLASMKRKRGLASETNIKDIIVIILMCDVLNRFD